MSDLDENITNILGITELEKKQGKFNDPKKQMQYELIQEQVEQAQLNTLMQLKIDYMNHTLSTYPTEWTPIINFIENQIKELKGDKFLEEQVRLARIDELKQARSVDSQFSSADIVDHLENRLKELKGDK